MLKAPVNKIIPFSSVDGPANRVAIFFQGCNFNCKFCHNPETINPCGSCGICVPTCPTGAITYDGASVVWDQSRCCKCETCIKNCPNDSSPLVEWMTPEELFKCIKKYLPFASGVTVSGGECTLQHTFLAEFFKYVKQGGKTTFVDSNGLLDFRTMEDMVEWMDMAMIDIKSTTEEEHQDLVGQSCHQVLENVRYLAQIGKLFEIRTVIIPNHLDNAYNVKVASELIKDYPSVRYKLIKYRQNGVREDRLKATTPTEEEMFALKAIAHANGVAQIIIL